MANGCRVAVSNDKSSLCVPSRFVFVYSFFRLIMDCVIFMWGKLKSAMCKLWVHGLYGLYGRRRLLSEKANKLNHSLTRSMLTRPLARVFVIRSQIIKMAVKILGHGKFKMSIDTNTWEFGNKIKHTKYFTIKWIKEGWPSKCENIDSRIYVYFTIIIEATRWSVLYYSHFDIFLLISPFSFLNMLFFVILQILKTFDWRWNLLTTAS